MRNLLLLAVHLLLALAAIQPLHAQQSGPPDIGPSMGSFTCFEGQSLHLTWLKKIDTRTGEPHQFNVDVEKGDTIIFASESSGKMLVTRQLDRLTMSIEPNGKQYQLAERNSSQWMLISDLFSHGKNRVTVTGAPVGQPLWLIKQSPCPNPEAQEQKPQIAIASGEAGRLDSAAISTVINNVVGMAAKWKFPANQLAQPTATPTARQLAWLPTATSSPTASATPTPTATMQPTLAPTDTRQPVAQIIPAPTHVATAIQSSPEQPDAQIAALLAATNALHRSVLLLIRLIQMGFMMMGLLVALYIGRLYRQPVTETLASVMNGEVVSNSWSDLQQQVGEARIYLRKQSKELYERIQAMLQK